MPKGILEEYAIVLDFLPHGHPNQKRRFPVAQVIGEEHFLLLEVVPKRDVFLKPKERVYIGPEKREKIHHIIGRIKYQDLTPTAKIEIESVLEELVAKKEKKFVEFFNKAGPITTRLNSLELVPGIGKRHMWKIIEERKIKPFESFEDIRKRVSLLPELKKAIAKRIIEELSNKDKYRIFVGQ